MATNQLKHLFFDLDDTLWDFEGNSSNVMRLLFNNYQLEYHLNTSFETFFENYKQINAGLWQQYSAKLISKEYLRNHRFELSFNTFNYSNYEMGLAFSEDYISHSPQGKLLKPNSLEILMYLKEKYALHVITNGFKEVQTILRSNYYQ
jgi:putative hydrolase of the HAD superfamily